MKLSEFIDQEVLSDPEWRAAYEESELRRESARMLAKARREQGISQAQLAERCGTDQAVISRIERGVVSPSLDTLWRVAAGLGMRPVLSFKAMTGPTAFRISSPRADRAPARAAARAPQHVSAAKAQARRPTAKAQSATGKAVARSPGKVVAGSSSEVTRANAKGGSFAKFSEPPQTAKPFMPSAGGGLVSRVWA
jgi:transcriptional regulator with XRE-family HTH domain